MTAAPTSITSPGRARELLREASAVWSAYGAKCWWALAGSAISQIQTLSLTLITARTLGDAEFGGFVLMFGTLAMAISIATLSLGLTSTRCVAFAHAEREQIASSLAACRGMALLSGTFASLLVACFAGPIARSMRVEGLAPALRIGAPYIFFMTGNAYQSGALVGFLAFREAMAINAIQLAIAIPATIWLTSAFGAPGAMAALSLCAFSTWAHSEATLRRILRARLVAIRYAVRFADIRAVSAIAMPASVAAILASVALWALTVVSSMQPGGVRLVGTFAVASNLRLASLFVPVVLQKVLAAHLSRAEYRSDRKRYERLYKRGLFGSVALTAIAAVVIFEMRGPLLSAFGRRQRVDDAFLAALLVAGIVESYATAAYQTIATAGSLTFQTMVILMWCPVLVGCAWLSAGRHWGGVGMAGSLALAWTVSSVAYTMISRRVLRGLGRAACD